MCPSVEEFFFFFLKLYKHRVKENNSIETPRRGESQDEIWWFFENTQSLAIAIPTFLDSVLYNVHIMGAHITFLLLFNKLPQTLRFKMLRFKPSIILPFP